MATVITNFHNDLLNWASKNGFSNVDFDFSENFEYDRTNHIVYLGINADDNALAINQFLYEYGSDYENLWCPIIALIHELAHHMTLPCFNEMELHIFDMAKESMNNIMDYWHIPDEFSANIWAINFMNTHYEALNELYQIMVNGYTAIYADGKIWDYIEEKENS